MTTALTFNDVTLSPVTYQNRLWIRSSELACALGYKRLDQIAKIYRVNADEFSSEMTQVIEITDNADSAFPVKARIFTLRGCHLVAMFARTPIAKAFRRWVLDVLDKLNEEQAPTPSQSSPTSPSSPITPADQSILQSIVKAKVEALPEERRSKGLYPQIWGRFNNHFRLGSYRQLPQCRMADAVAYLTQLAVREPAQALPPTPPTIEPLRVTDNDSADLDAHLDAIQEHIRAIFDHQCSIFRLGRNALPSRSAVPSRVWGASVLTLDSLEKSSDALRACLASLELSARAAVVAGRA